MGEPICPARIEAVELRVTQLEVNLANLLWLLEQGEPKPKPILVQGCFPLLPLKELHDEALE